MISSANQWTGFYMIESYEASQKSKGNQTIKFSLLIECNMRNVFLQKSCRKWSRKTSSRTFFLKKKLYMK